MTVAELDLDFAAVESHLERLLDEPFTVDAAGARAGGMSQLNLVARARSGRQVIVRVPPVDGTLAPYDVAREARLMACAAAGGIPVADVLSTDPDGAITGRPLLVLDFVAGDVLLPRRPWPQPRGERLADELIRLLARIQSVPVAPLLAADGRPVRDTGAMAQLGRWTTSVERDAPDGLAVLPTYAAAWLRERMPAEDGERVLVHGDYRLGNMIWAGDSIAVVLDWEEAGVGDRYYDLAWLLMGTDRDSDLVMGLLPRAELIERFAAATRPVDPDVLGWWEVLTGWVRIAMEIRGVQLNRRAAVADLRASLWEFGHASSYRQLLRKIHHLDGGG